MTGSVGQSIFQTWFCSKSWWSSARFLPSQPHFFFQLTIFYRHVSIKPANHNRSSHCSKSPNNRFIHLICFNEKSSGKNEKKTVYISPPAQGGWISWLPYQDLPSLYTLNSSPKVPLLALLWYCTAWNKKALEKRALNRGQRGRPGFFAPAPGIVGRRAGPGGCRGRPGVDIFGPVWRRWRCQWRKSCGLKKERERKVDEKSVCFASSCFHDEDFKWENCLKVWKVP